MSDVTSTSLPGDGAGQQKFFISYRRTDKNDAARQIAGAIRTRFGAGSVYFDVEQPPGIDWLRRIRTSIADALVVVVVIGPFWLSILQTRDRERRNGGSDDYTRREIEWALENGRCHVVPVLVDAEVPRKEELPRSVRRLVVRKNAKHLRHDSFESDLETLLDHLGSIVGVAPDEPRWEPDELAEPTAAAPLDADVAEPGSAHYAEVIKALLRGRVVPILGTSLRGGLPDARFLAQALAQGWSPPFDGDLAEVAQRYVASDTDGELFAAVDQLITTVSTPSAVHRFLAELPRLERRAGRDPHPQLIISMNYDRALEDAFDELGEPYDHVVYLPSERRFLHVPWGENAGAPAAVVIEDAANYTDFPINSDRELARTVIVKLNGSAELLEADCRWDANYVITEDHFMDYVSLPVIPKQLPPALLLKVVTSSCLFLGYTLHDWNDRILLRQIWQGDVKKPRSWAVTNRPDELERALWGDVRSHDLRSARPGEYVAQLRAALVDELTRTATAG